MDSKEDGSVAMLIEELAPGGQASLNVTVIPKLYGIYESTRAKIKYIPNSVIEGDDPLESNFRVGYSTSLGRIKIVSAQEHLRATSYYLKDWALFSITSGTSFILPFVFWYLAKASNVKITKRKAN